MLRRASNVEVRLLPNEGCLTLLTLGLYKPPPSVVMQIGNSSTYVLAQGEDVLRDARAHQRDRPFLLRKVGERQYWWFHDKFYWDNDELSADDVFALVVAREKKKQRKLERAKTEAFGDVPKHRRESIPDDVKMFVWQRDEGRCVKCGAKEGLEFDHIIPVTRGGGNTARNLQLLCERCNREKGSGII